MLHWTSCQQDTLLALLLEPSIFHTLLHAQSRHTTKICGGGQCFSKFNSRSSNDYQARIRCLLIWWCSDGFGIVNNLDTLRGAPPALHTILVTPTYPTDMCRCWSNKREDWSKLWFFTMDIAPLYLLEYCVVVLNNMRCNAIEVRAVHVCCKTKAATRSISHHAVAVALYAQSTCNRAPRKCGKNRLLVNSQ